MNQRSYSTEAVILSRRNYGEADRLLTIFSKHYGKLRVVAKGIRRTTSRKKGSLELFNYSRMLLIKGKNMDLIADTEIKNDFSAWRKDLKRVGVAYHLSEVVERLTPEGQELEDVFNLLVLAFEKLDKMKYEQLVEFVYRFKIRVLEELGFLGRNREVPKDLDEFIGDLINGELKTKKFLKTLGAN